jgi:hypothetical protein
MSWLTEKVLRVAVKAALPAVLGALITALVGLQLLDPRAAECLEQELRPSGSSSIPHSSRLAAFQSQPRRLLARQR